ncbi:MAG: hypothetical protein ABI591_04065 [Kofleriaceae bacterium]
MIKHCIRRAEVALIEMLDGSVEGSFTASMRCTPFTELANQSAR